ncbi:noncanonical pyrimidine nucleotidase, YjjG family [Marinilabiliaceae bacterium JC017]|nr:noncanonical pyrimidine nucleotidase, YjjG family [Marinilabiliaceae bacterium JC017]
MNSKKYSHLFFDLDRTLWDFDRNLEITMEEIFNLFKLSDYFRDYQCFKSIFDHHNVILWRDYFKDLITKDELLYRRFDLCLKEVGVDNLELAKKMSDSFNELNPKQTATFPHAHETLNYLKEKGYQLHIISNGFLEAQRVKLRNSELYSFFTHLITSEAVGYHKPHPAIFASALSKAEAKPEESLMVGDDPERDIEGASNFGIDTVYFNPNQINTTGLQKYEIKDLLELKEIL